jgi:hypothetical protein
VTRDDWQLIVTRVDRRRVAEVRVVRPPQVRAAVSTEGTEAPA